MKIFRICPVRGITVQEEAAIARYVAQLEEKGFEVYWPFRDTKQDDPVGLRICEDNRRAIKRAHEVHVWWNPSSQGSLFDFGMAFAMRKKVLLANRDSVAFTAGRKSFQNVLLVLDATTRSSSC